MLASYAARTKSLHFRLAWLVALISAIAAVSSAVLGTAITSRRLITEVDSGLKAEALRLAGRVSRRPPILDRIPVGALPTGSIPATPAAGSGLSTGPGAGPKGSFRLPNLGGAAGAGRTLFQVFDSAGKVSAKSDLLTTLKLGAKDIAVAKGAPTIVYDEHLDDSHFRVATAAVGGIGVQAARQIDDIDRARHSLAVEFAIIAAFGTIVAATLSALTARAALKPVASLADAAHSVAESRDPGMSVPEEGGTELVTLGQAINTMLRSLDSGRRQQQQLIDDAAHELRTPLTSMRTNIEVLVQDDSRLVGEDRRALLRDLEGQMDEFVSLVSDLGELSRNGAETVEFGPVDMSTVVGAAVERARRRSSVPIELVGGPTTRTPDQQDVTVTGSAALLERAILNVVDNALKFSTGKVPVRVALDGSTVTVTDDGCGISDVDLPHAFDRFWRSEDSRSLPGSGLGLAIVKDVVDRHQGTVELTRRSPSGLAVTIWIPKSSRPDSSQKLTF